MVNVGVPAASLAPAKPRKFKELTGLLELAIPVRGAFPLDFNRQGNYDICPEEGVILFGLLTEALLAHKVYPDLGENQLFILAGVEVEVNVLTVVGRVVEVLNEAA